MKKERFEIDESNGRLTVLLCGDIDHHSAACLRVELDRLIYEKKPRVFAMNVRKIEFMDSSGLGLIMGRYNLVKDLGGEFILSEPNERIKKICSLVGLERIIKIENCSEGKKHESKKKA